MNQFYFNNASATASIIKGIRANFPSPQDVHLRSIWLDCEPGTAAQFRSLLSESEIAQADHFKFAYLSRDYEIAHGALRLLLSRYLGCSPTDLSFSTGPAGKPALREAPELNFNLSHSGRLAACVFAVGCELGVDIEVRRPIEDILDLARRYFSPQEANVIRQPPDGVSQQDLFLRCWTRKEAYVKAIGTGLGQPLDQFQVTLLPDEPARFVHIGNSPRAAEFWTLHHVEPAAGYVGAIAYQDQARRVLSHAIQTPEELLADLS